MNVLYSWNIELHDNYFRCTGIFEGRDWITSPIMSMLQSTDHYVVYTENSVYYLYW